MANAIANIKKPAEAIMWMLALNLAKTIVRHVIVEIKMPIKKKYSSGISLMGSTRDNTKITIRQFIISGNLRSETFDK